MNKSSKFHRLMQVLAMFLCVAMVAGTFGTANAVKAASAPANYSTDSRIVISETDKLSDVVWKDDGSDFDVKFAVSFSVNDSNHKNTTVGVKTTWLESADGGKTYTETKTTDGTNGSIRNVSLDENGKSEKLSNSLSVVSDKGLAESKAGMLYKVKIEVYTITGYNWRGGYIYSRTPVIAAETTPTVKLIYSSYVTFKNGDEKVVKEVPYGEKVTVDDPKAPQGKVFAGWYDGTDKDANLVDLKNTEITGPQTLYAHFSDPPVTKFTVTFSNMYDGKQHHGRSIVKTETVESGKTVTRPEKDPTCDDDGHIFVDWYTDNTFATKFDFENTKIESDTTILALWSFRVNFAVKWENGLPNGLTFDTPLNPTQVNCTFPVTSAIENINSITLGNGEYVIDGWQVGKKANYWSNNITYTDIDINTYKITENTNLYAKVKKVEKHDVTYYDGSTKLHTDKVKDGDTYTIPEAYAKLTNTDNHKTFLGWFTNPECTKAYEAKKINANLDLYAGWKTEYTVTFSAGEGKTFSPAISERKVVSGSTTTLPATATESTGNYDFTGWTLNGVSVSGNYTVKGDVTFVANWEEKVVKHKVTFVAREGNDEDTPRHRFEDVVIWVEDGKLIDPSQIPENPKCGISSHVFGGWYTTIELTTPFNFETMTITEDTRIYSGWFTGTAVVLDANEAEKSYTEGDTLNLTNVKILIKQKRINGNYVVTSEIPVEADMVTNFDTVTKTAGNNKSVEVNYNNKKYYYSINVAKKIIDGSITLTDTEITKTYGTEPFVIGYKDATGKVSFESNDPKIAIVENGQIVIVGVGKTTITVKVAPNGNYTATEKTVTLFANPKPVSVVWDEKTLVLPYNGDEQAPEVLVEGILEKDQDTVKVTVSGEQTNVGNDYVATVSVDSENYVIAEEDAERSFSIVPKTVKVIWTNTELDYNGTEQGPDAALADGSICEGDEVNVTVSGKATNVGNEYVATASIDNDNYVILEDTASVDYSIAPKTVELVWSNTEFVYDGTEKKPSASINGELFGTDKCNVTVTGSQTDAGEYTAYASLDNGNYEISDDFKEKEFVISPKEVKELTVTIGTLVCGTEIEPLVAEGMLRAIPMGLRFRQNWNDVTVKFSDEDAKYYGMFIIAGNLSEETESELRLFTGKIEGGKNYMSGLQMSLDSNHVLASDAKVTVIYGNETLKAVDLTQFNSEKDLSDAFVSNSVMVFNSEEEIMIAANLLAVHVPGEAKRVDVAAATFEKEGQYDMVVSCTECETEISREPFPIAKLENNIEEVTFGGFDKVKKEYLINDELDVTGLTVTVKMTNGDVTTSAVTKDMVSGFNSKVENSALVLSVSYSGKAANYTVSVSEPAGEFVVEGDTKFNGKDNMKLHIIHTNAKRNALIFSQFGGIEMDGKVVGTGNYDATEGSIKLDIHADYLKTLTEGEHTLTVDIGEDKVDVKISVTQIKEENTQPAQQAATSDNAPSTGDTGSLVLWYVIALIALLSAAALAVARQKSRREEF